MRKSNIRTKITAGEKAIGFGITFPSVEMFDIVGHLGFDYAHLDAEIILRVGSLNVRVGVISILPAVVAAAPRVRNDTLLRADVAVIVRDCLLECRGIVVGIPIPDVG